MSLYRLVLGQMRPKEPKLEAIRGIVLGGPRRVSPSSGDFKTRDELHQTAGVDRPDWPRAPVDKELVEAMTSGGFLGTVRQSRFYGLKLALSHMLVIRLV